MNPYRLALHKILFEPRLNSNEVTERNTSVIKRIVSNFAFFNNNDTVWSSMHAMSHVLATVLEVSVSND